METALTISRGRPLPLGVHGFDGGMNFAVFSRHATRMWLLLFDDPAVLEPTWCFELDPVTHRTGDIWHVYVHGARPGLTYVFQADGPFAPHEGHRFNPQRALLDPYATALTGVEHWDFAMLCDRWLEEHPGEPIPKAQYRVKGLVPSEREFDWNGDRHPKIPWSETVIYETHVRGLTIHPSSCAHYPGTYLGVIEKIPYFKELGITTLELMPVHQFNPHELDRKNPLTGEPLVNYWGYSTVAFFAPHAQYSTGRSIDAQITEFKAMVKALHEAGIEVILDVVFNHTAEGNEHGPTLNFKGLDNSIYYLLDEHDKSRYLNYSGCGNTFNCNHPVVRSYILECLRYWVTEMHVDGFRFDLASILGRDRSGKLVPNPPLLESIAEDPILGSVKLIAEAWDAGGAYQVGFFPGERWSEWNGQYRDDVRRYWRGDDGMIGPFATRLCGSADLYQHSGKTPLNSINFVTSHDGFTLNDLVSYEHKHNEANGEDNRDGTNENYTCNYGVEGPSDDPEIEAVRLRQIKNFLATLFLSRGVPMLLGGDEFRRTQRGNNNAYCQDNEISWYDWRLMKRNRQLVRFVSRLIRFRRAHPVLRKGDFYQSEEIEWFGLHGSPPDWRTGRALGAAIHPLDPEEPQLCLLFNAAPEAVSFHLPPPPPGQCWHVAVDTAAAPPEDIAAVGKEKKLRRQDQLTLIGRSLYVLVARAKAGRARRRK
ncbi:isoamylase [Methylomarinovum caldicuralii]|uniref:Isoamylase n=1 Tax=Methylomarinovum caldicuralii TaxID=438856 RepID=A0AAU9BUP9_9GAMM|nr:glycogen debranching protein GlgX [Methylomarinovum caldicuralii]BCX82421.1 isoamylase [Methylomarinovum caldicuralii]